MTAGRQRLLELARAKPVPPYTLDEELTFFCPRENLDGLDQPQVRAFHRDRGGRLPADVLTRPWCLRLLLQRLEGWTPR